MNTLKTAILMAGLTALVMAIGYWLGHTTGMIYDFLLAGALMLLSRFAWLGRMFGGYGGSGDRRRDDGGMNPIAALVMIIVAPIAAAIIQLAISRSREYAADESGGRLTKRPLSLANALLELEARNQD